MIDWTVLYRNVILSNETGGRNDTGRIRTKINYATVLLSQCV